MTSRQSGWHRPGDDQGSIPGWGTKQLCGCGQVMSPLRGGVCHSGAGRVQHWLASCVNRRKYTDGLQPADSQRFVPLGLVLFPTDLPSLGESHLSCLNPVFTSHFHPQEPEGIFPHLHDLEIKGQ